MITFDTLGEAIGNAAIAVLVGEGRQIGGSERLGDSFIVLGDGGADTRVYTDEG